MAKHKTAGQTAGNVTAFQINQLSTDLQGQVRALKTPIMSAAHQFGIYTEKKKELAKPVMRLFRAIAAHYDTVPGAKTFRFVDFVRMIDPSVPTARAEYVLNRTYQTMNNIRAQDQADNRESQQGKPQGGALRDKAVVVLARVIKFVQQLPGIDGNKVAQDIIEQAGLSDNTLTRFSRRLNNDGLKPMWRATVSGRNASIKLDPVPMSESEIKALETTADSSEPLTQGGRTIHVPAEVQEQAAALGRSLTRGHGRQRKSA